MLIDCESLITEDLFFYYGSGKWNFASSTGEPKKTLDCIDLIPKEVDLVMGTDEIYFSSTTKEKKFL